MNVEQGSEDLETVGVEEEAGAEHCVMAFRAQWFSFFIDSIYCLSLCLSLSLFVPKAFDIYNKH